MMATPPPADKKKLDAMAHCIHSEIHAASKNWLPDYRCCKRSHRPLCKLYRDVCSKFEPFPESFNT